MRISSCRETPRRAPKGRIGNSPGRSPGFGGASKKALARATGSDCKSISFAQARAQSYANSYRGLRPRLFSGRPFRGASRTVSRQKRIRLPIFMIVLRACNQARKNVARGTWYFHHGLPATEITDYDAFSLTGYFFPCLTTGTTSQAMRSEHAIISRLWRLSPKLVTEINHDYGARHRNCIWNQCYNSQIHVP